MIHDGTSHQITLIDPAFNDVDRQGTLTCLPNATFSFVGTLRLHPHR